MPGYRLNITLEEGQWEKLRRLAARTHLQEGTLARSLLSTALDHAEDARTELDFEQMTPSDVVSLLDGISGAFERAELGRRQVAAGEGIPLEEW